jgi:hypothetical protein
VSPSPKVSIEGHDLIVAGKARMTSVQVGLIAEYPIRLSANRWRTADGAQALCRKMEAAVDENLLAWGVILEDVGQMDAIMVT